MLLHLNQVDEDSSHAARFAILFYIMVSLTLCGGTVFGFAGLKTVLLDESVYAELCSDFNGDGATYTPCNAQMLRLDLMFTLASSLFSAYLLPAGLLLRSMGPRACFLLGFALVIIGSGLFVVANSRTFDVYIVAFVLIGTGNPLLYIAAFNFSKLYPSSSNLLLSIFIGCFGFSAIVFYLFDEVHFIYGLTSQQLFRAFVFLPASLALIGMFVLPKDVYHVMRQRKLSAASNAVAESDVADGASEKTPLLESNEQNGVAWDGNSTATTAVAAGDTNKAKNTSFIGVPLKDASLSRQLRSAPFFAQMAFFSWGMLHLNFYLGTIYDQLLLLDDTGGALADVMIDVFSLSYPFGCLASILPVGLLVRNCSVSTSLYTYCAVNLIFSSMALLPNLSAQWITIHMFILVRVAFFTVMSTYSANVFGFANLSTMFGAAGCVAGLVSLGSSGLNYVALTVQDDFTLVNGFMLAGAVLNFTFPYTVKVFWENKQH
jgi:MFS family permease